MVLHDLDWLIGGTLGASMLFSSITTVHGIALAAVRGRGTVDLDIIPVFAITGVGMLVGTPMMIWSKTIRGASRSARTIVFAWIGVMFVGVLASVASLKAVPKPQPCDPASLLTGSCGLACNATLPMRAGQNVISIPYLWKNELFDYSGWFAAYGSWLALLGVMYAASRQTPREQAQEALHANGMSKRLRQKNAGRTYACAFCVPPMSLAFALSQIVITELIMLGPHHIPLGEGLDALGQWSTLVGAFFAILAAVIKYWIDRKSQIHPTRGRKWPANDNDLEASSIQAVAQAYHPGLQPKKVQKEANHHPGLGGTGDNDPSPPTNGYDFGQVFKEGAWWGHRLDGTRISHEGITWIVQDGKLQRDAETST